MPGLEDILNISQMLKTHLLVIGVALVLAVLVSLLVFSRSRARRMLIRGNAWLIFVLVLAITVNLVLLGPGRNFMHENFLTYEISQESRNAAAQCSEAIAAEGITLLKNDGLLPLQTRSLNVFGWASTNPVYGCDDTSAAVSLTAGLTAAGFTLNEELLSFYTDHADQRTGFDLPEPEASAYSDALLQNAAAFSDTALFVIARPGSDTQELPVTMSGVDGWDEGDHYLQLSNREEALLELVCGTFSNVVVIINSANVMELGFLNDHPQIKAALYVPTPGARGFSALGNILTGAVNPSGRTVDTWLYDLTSAPSWSNRVSVPCSNADSVGTAVHSLNYAEGIYTGYKFYETAAVEGLIDYDATVQFPFGYGLSYTTFSHQLSSLTETDGTLTFQVMVTNTGTSAGKDVVQIYCASPYTGSIEKASVNLVDFCKTVLLEPGNSQSISFSIDLEELVSYDASRQLWVLEAGEYQIRLQSDAHTLLESQIYSLAEEKIIASDASNLPGSGNVTLSRANGFANFNASTAAPGAVELTDAQLEQLQAFQNYDPLHHNIPTDQVRTSNIDSGLAPERLRGLAYDDPVWDTYLDQLRQKEMVALVTGDKELAGLDQEVSHPLCGEILLASTWSAECAASYGSAMASLASDLNYAAWNGLDLTLHRDAFAGSFGSRFSEDPVLTGKLAAAAMESAREQGIIPCATGILPGSGADVYTCSWVDAQALRENWLRPYAIAIQSGSCGAIALHNTALGTTRLCHSSALLTDIMRNQLGFRGIILTQSTGQAMDLALRSGCDVALDADLTDTVTPTSLSAVRQACKHILYASINSRLYGEEVLDPGITGWMIVMFCIDALIIILLILWEMLLIRRYRKMGSRRAAWLAPADRTDKSALPDQEVESIQRSQEDD